MSLEERISLKTSSGAAPDLALDLSAETERSCQSAKQLEEVGDYEGARVALGDRWRRVGERPNLDGLSKAAQGELLLRAGTVSGSIGGANQIQGGQEIAKDLITESIRIFSDLALAEKVAEGQINLAVCYWREGAFDEARVTLKQVLDQLRNEDSEQRLRALLAMATVERSSTRYEDALRIHREAAPLFEKSDNHALKGKFHGEYGTVLKNLGLAEQREGYVDQALIEYAAASYHFDRAGHKSCLACVENNIGMLLLTLGKTVEAHQHLNRARALLVKLRDKGRQAQVDETRARAFLAEGRNAQAELAARGSVRILEEGDERSLLAEALTTHGTALARLGRFERALAQMQKAIEVAEQAGDSEHAGIAAVSIVEELSASIRPPKLRKYYRDAESLLAQSQDPSIARRLGDCARRILAAEHARGDYPNISAEITSNTTAAAETSGDGLAQKETEDSAATWAGCSLYDEVRQFEGKLIRRALEASGGSITRAARMLQVTHQGLAFILNGRHSGLLAVRKPIRSRRRSILRKR
jgi:tetratricopeptide (TPR) repeat protein